MQSKPSEEISRVAIRFAGDSGDGIQLTGSKFTDSTALAGNDISTRGAGDLAALLHSGDTWTVEE